MLFLLAKVLERVERVCYRVFQIFLFCCTQIMMLKLKGHPPVMLHRAEGEPMPRFSNTFSKVGLLHLRLNSGWYEAALVIRYHGVYVFFFLL